jgi:DNA-binding HxlR family transcriptional regulator
MVLRKNRVLPLKEIWEILSDKPNGEVVFDCIKEKKAFSELRECFKMLEE